MEGIIDFHTHAFRDDVAEKAVPLIENQGNIEAKLDGKVSSLLFSMDKNGIEKSIVCSIATKPKQFNSIIIWSKEIYSERIIPFPSFHPYDPSALEKIEIIKKEGFKGIKLHPYYQNFDIDEKRMYKIYEKIEMENLILVLHTGFDFAFERIKRADPLKILKVKENFPKLKLVVTHLGGWNMWDEVEEFIIGQNIYMDISYSLDFLSPERAKKMIKSHPEDYILFGSDSPWKDQGETLELFRKLNLGKKLEIKILKENALKLLNSV